MPSAGRRRPGGSRPLALVAAVAVLAGASVLTIPMRPVPLTLQTLVVALVGAALGWRWGLAAILAWLALGAVGAPVLAGGTGGLARFAGPSAGFLAAFPIAGALAGRRAERGETADAGGAFATMLAVHAVCLGLGAAWLAPRLGLDHAVRGTLPPLLPGALVKSAVGAAILVRLPRPRG